MENEKITNQHGNEINAEAAALLMAQYDQCMSDRAWQSADTYQEAFDAYCAMWLDENGSEFVLNTENPQW